jgi:hypothetical protein
MKIWTRIGIALTLALTGKQALATTATVAMAGITAVQLGADPIPWIIGAAGSTVVYAYRKPSTRAHALANGVICVFLGGVGAPFAGQLLTHYAGPLWSNEYMLAGLLSVAWPWAAPVAWRRAIAFVETKGQPNE